MAQKLDKKSKFKQQVKKAQAKRHYKEVRKASKEFMRNLGSKGEINATKLPNRKSYEDKPVKVDKRKTAKVSMADVLSARELRSNMSKKQIADYIKEAVKVINKSIPEMELDYRVQQSFDYLSKRFGTYRGKLTTMSKARKEDMLTYARNLKSHLVIDDYTSYGKDKIEKKTQKAFATYIEHNPLRTDIDITEFADISKMFSKLSSSIIEKYGSTNLIELLETQQESDLLVSPEDFASIAIDVYERNKGKGYSPEDLAMEFEDELKNIFDETYLED